MGGIDPGLRHILSTWRRPDGTRRREVLRDLEEASPLALAGAQTTEPTVTVLLQFTGPVTALEEAGFVPRTVAGDVATGVVPLTRVEELADHPGTVFVEASRTLEPELDQAVADARVDDLHDRDPARKGAGALVGIIDSGVHYPHGAFRNADGTTRIVSIWDHTLDPGDSDAVSGEANPAGYSYGVEWDQAAIDSALTATDPFSMVRHDDGGSNHGTHVTGIAAGNGRALDPSDPVTSRVGVAPEADIAVVAVGGSTERGGLGASANALDAVAYLLDLAVRRGQPISINMSLGSNVGGSRDGRTLLERGIDNLLGAAGRVMVKSAGNEGNKDRHAAGTVSEGSTTTVGFTIVDPPGSDTPPTSAIIDIWYSFIADVLQPTDELGVSITPPGGTESTVVAPGDDDGSGNPPTLSLSNGNEAVVDSSHLSDFPWNIASRIFIRLQSGTQATLTAGSWSLKLHGTTVATPTGEWHAWIDRSPDPAPTFDAADPATTITIPGTASEIITAAAHSASSGSIAAFSSRGPTRDGRTSPVPTVAAPGVGTVAPVGPSVDASGYDAKQGTSMAAPVVTGALALILAEHPHLTAAQLRSRLTAGARSDGDTGTVPNDTWGAGKIDAEAAFDDTTASGCFVASAVYRDAAHPDVDALRALRDRRLAPDARGRRAAVAVNRLYHRVGPPLARGVRPRPMLAAVLRSALFRPAAALLRRHDHRREG